MMSSTFATRFPDPASSPGLLLWRVTNAWQRAIRAALSPYDLTHVQFVLLATLASQHPSPLTQRDLAEHAATDAMMTSQVVRALATKHLVVREPHPSDRRAMLVSLTRAGRELVDGAVGAVESADASYFAALGDRAGEFRDMLGTLASAEISSSSAANM